MRLLRCVGTQEVRGRALGVLSTVPEVDLVFPSTLARLSVDLPLCRAHLCMLKVLLCCPPACCHHLVAGQMRLHNLWASSGHRRAVYQTQVLPHLPAVDGLRKR